MNRVAFVFTRAPHGSSAGREGLDAALAMGALSEDIGLFLSVMACCSLICTSNLRRLRAVTMPRPLACWHYMRLNTAISAGHR